MSASGGGGGATSAPPPLRPCWILWLLIRASLWSPRAFASWSAAWYCWYSRSCSACGAFAWTAAFQALLASWARPSARTALVLAMLMLTLGVLFGCSGRKAGGAARVDAAGCCATGGDGGG